MEAIIVCAILGLGGWWWLVCRAAQSHDWRAPAGEWNAGDAILGGAMGLFFLMGILGGGDTTKELTPEEIRSVLGFCVFVVVLIVCVVMARGRSLHAAFGLAPADPMRVVALAVACIMLAYPVVMVATEAASRLTGPVSEADPMVRYFRGDTAVADRLWAIALVVVAGPFMEELLFRGYLYGVVRRYAGRLWGALTTALLFAAVHQNVPAIPAYFLLAMALTLAYEITGSLWAPIVMHALFNLASVVIIVWFPQWGT